ncbi:MAG: hypothetical protein AAFW47_00525 [Pseudomonadota bacterium]
MNDDLFLAILAMDAYNRGYEPGISGLGGSGSQIGTATFKQDDQSDEAIGAGFYAAAYELSNGQKVISYRGTDDPSGARGGSDALTGWFFGAGLPVFSQLGLAESIALRSEHPRYAAAQTIV